MKKNFLSFLFILASLSSFSQGVSCDNFADGPIFVNEAVTTLPFDIYTTGVNDLAINPLAAVKIKLSHNWISDVAVSLLSPSGIEYVIVGDDDNNYGGCQISDYKEFDISIVQGDFNPLTNGESYDYSCFFGNCFGNFTVYYPMFGPNHYSEVFDAFSCPSGDLNDFNQPGDPINGEWQVKFGCVCPESEGNFVFMIEDCQLIFENQEDINCSYPSAISLNTEDQSSCLYEESALSQVTGVANFDFLGAFYEFALFVVQDSVVQEVLPLENILGLYDEGYIVDLSQNTSLDTGVYEIYLLEKERFGGNDPLIAQEYLGVNIENFASLNANFNAYTSLESISLTIFESVPPQEIYFTEHCPDECIEYNGVEYCEAGTYEQIDTAACSLTLIHNVPLACLDGNFDPISFNACLDTPISISSDLPPASSRWTFSNGEIIETESNVLETIIEGYAEYLTVEVSAIALSDVLEATQLISIFPSYCETQTLEVTTLTQSDICFNGAISNVETCDGERTNFNLNISNTDNCLLFRPEEYSCETVCLRYIEEDIPHDVTLEICAVENLIDVPSTNLQNGNSSIVSDFSVFPNPTSGILNYSFQEETRRTIKILNVFGKELYRQETEFLVNQIDISAYPAGVYWIVSQEGNEGLSSQKFVKK